jgi:hypothetical protein
VSKNFSVEGWQGILRGQAMPGDILVGESIAVYVHRKFATLIAERDALQQLLNQRDAQIDATACKFPQMCSSACGCTKAVPNG